MLRLLGIVAALLVADGTAVRAQALPPWAVGSWRAVAAIVDEDITQMGRAGVPATLNGVQHSTLEITPHTFKASVDGEVGLIEGRHVDATTRVMAPRDVKTPPTHPMIVGQNLTYSMTDPVPVALLSVRGCREPWILGTTQLPALAPRCRGSFTLMQFPDASHLAVADSGGLDIVIFERR